MSDKHIYRQAFDELNAGTIDPALWAMVWTRADGDEAKAKARYIEERVREIEGQQRRTRKTARVPPIQRIPWRLLGLTTCAVLMAVVNQAVSRNAQVDLLPPQRWDFYLVGLAGYTAGLMLLPLVPVLVAWGGVWGFRIAFFLLWLVGCGSGAGGVPTYSDVRGQVIMGYVAAGALGILLWLSYKSMRQES